MKRSLNWRDLFVGHRVYSATAGSNVGHNWKITDTSSGGTPTYVPASNDRAVALTFDNTNEIQNVCLNFGDVLSFDIDDLVEARFRVKMAQSAVNAATMMAFGLQSARNDAIDSIAAHASFRVIGADSTTNVVVESDDGTVDKDDVASGLTLINAYKDFVISFANGKKDVRFFIDGQPVALDTTFDMSNYSGSLQPYCQLQKTASTNTDGVVFGPCEVTFRE